MNTSTRHIRVDGPGGPLNGPAGVALPCSPTTVALPPVALPLYTTDLCQGGRSNDRLAHPAAYAPVEHNTSEDAAN